MAHSPSNALGIDLGQNSAKAVLLGRRGGGKYSLMAYAIRPLSRRADDPDAVASQVQSILGEIKHAAKACSVAVSDPSMVLRIIEQPATPVEMLRNALAINASAFLHQDCKDYVLDVDHAGGTNGLSAANAQSGQQENYVVAGLPRRVVERISAAFARNRQSLERVDVTPICLFNAFEFAEPDVFRSKPFILIDFGHKSSTVVGGVAGVLAMVRTIDYGGSSLIDDLTMNGAIDRAAAVLLIEQNDPGLAQTAQTSLAVICREVRNSIGFLESRWEKPLERVFVSGGATRAEMVIQTLSDELNLPCEIWDPMPRLEVQVPSKQRAGLEKDGRCLNVAFGAAFGLLQPQR